MKIFWAWQSDRPGRTNRFFVRDALKQAIEALKKPRAVEELFEAERPDEIHLDQDRQGVSGSPPLAATILKKIDASSVLVADVSPVAQIEQVGEDGQRTTKTIMNPNVAIELGYAAKSIGDTSILMVMNKQYGGRKDLPFDLAHLAGPIYYDLPEDADSTRIKAEQKKLAGILKQALKPFIDKNEPTDHKLKFPSHEPRHGTMHWFESGEEIAWIGEARDGDRVGYKFPTDRYFYLRITPHTPPAEKFRLTDLRRFVHDARVPVFDIVNNRFIGQNRYGVILFNPKNPTSDQLTSCTQFFRTGEVWALNRSLFVDYEGQITIPAKKMSDILTTSLRAYLQFLARTLGFTPPFDAEFGARGLQDCGLVVVGIDDQSPKRIDIYEHQFSKHLTFNKVEEGTIIKARKDMIDELFAATAHDAPIQV